MNWQEKRQRVFLEEIEGLQTFPQFVNNFVFFFKEQILISDSWNIKISDSYMHFYKLGLVDGILILDVELVVDEKMKQQVM